MVRSVESMGTKIVCLPLLANAPFSKMVNAGAIARGLDRGVFFCVYILQSQHAARTPGQRHIVTKHVGRSDVLTSLRCLISRKDGRLI